MEKYIRHGFRAEQIPTYDCSVMNLTTDQWYAQGEISYPLGYSFLAYGSITEIIYATVMPAMWRLRRTNLCYNFMFFLGCFDMLGIGVNSLVTGVLWFSGACYCTSPDLTYIVGSLGVGLWCGSCLCCFILVLNRICDLWNPFINEKVPFSDPLLKNLVLQVFGGNSTYIWISLPLFYTLYVVFFTPPVLFNSKIGSWFFSPFITGTAEEMAMFYNYAHTVNNLAVVVITSLLYVVLSLLLAHKYNMGGISKISKIQRSIMLQSTLICLASLVGSFIYVYMQFFLIPSWLIMAAHFCWQAGHGTPAYVYLILNKTIQSEIRRLFRFRDCSSVTDSTYSANQTWEQRV